MKPRNAAAPIESILLRAYILGFYLRSTQVRSSQAASKEAINALRFDNYKSGAI